MSFLSTVQCEFHWPRIMGELLSEVYGRYIV